MALSRFLTAAITTAFFTSSMLGCGDTQGPAPAATGYDVARYDLRGAYDWARGRLVATVGITLTATEEDLAHVVLDSAVTEVKAVRAGETPLPFSADEEGRKLVVDLGELGDIEIGDTLVLSIDYEAASGGGLSALPVRAGDPAAARALYTSSEPTGAPRWMPCHDRPDDRAIFSVELKMDDGESMIANGDLELEARDGAGHRMRYATKYPLPTYLMAFAVSDFEVEQSQEGEVPVAVWHRRGVAGDYPRLLDELDREISLISKRLGPYPFEKYALVMLPEFPGGMENAGITFQSETRSAEPSLGADVTLNAHELGHQWFGDLVTVATWDDLWIKEGMATLLSAEAGRRFQDESGAQTLLGDDFGVRDGAAIRDRSLAPGDKYTSGPYDRAAWLLTQIRAVAGEEAFWGTLRAVLEKHRFGTIGTDDILSAFAKVIGPEAAARARKAVDAKATPTIGVAALPSGAAQVTLHDPEGVLVAPMEIAWHRADGTVTTEALAPEEPVELRRESAADFVVLDPRDIHPDWSSFFADDASRTTFDTLVAPLRAPADASGAKRFAELPGAHESAALAGGALPPVGPEAFADFVASLDAEGAKALSVEAACAVAGAEADPQTKLAWRGVLKPQLEAPYYGGLGYVSSYDACADFVDPAMLFAAEWAELAKGLSTEAVSEPRLAYLSKFSLPADEGLAVWSNLVESGYSPRVRALAAQQIRRYAERAGAASTFDRAAARARVAELIGGSEVSSVLAQLIPAAVALEAESASDNATALDALAEVLRSPATRGVQSQAVCAAYELSAGDAEAFAAFAERVEDAPLAADAAALLADPGPCEG